MNVPDFLLRSIPLLIQFYADWYLETDLAKTMVELETELNVPIIKTYDFIIVGGGSAGCVLAGRLSENFDVLLLERGGNPPPAARVPYYMSEVKRAPSIHNYYTTVPQPNASLCCNGRTPSTANMLGGTGSKNGMMHSRGSPKDFDNWANILQDDSFNFENVVKYFKKLETFVGHKFETEHDDYYGTDGPITVNTNLINTPLLDTWMEAGRELGYDTFDPSFQQEGIVKYEPLTEVKQFYAGMLLGFAPVNIAARRGQRSSSYVEYVEKYEESRSTLTVIRYANVSEVLLDDNKRAYGVAYTRHGFPQIAHARNEIILSAGAFSSPLLLMKSGIGPESILNAAEIAVKVPLEAVGQNLFDHHAVRVRFRVEDPYLLPNYDPTETYGIAEEYHNGEGLLATHTIDTNFTEEGVLTVRSVGTQCFIVSSKGETGWPDLWIQMQQLVSVENKEHRLEFFILIGRPKSNGVLSLDTEKYKAGIRDETQLTLLDFKSLTHPDDVDVILEGVRLVLRIVETDAFRKTNMTAYDQTEPACEEFTFNSDDYWRCIIQQRAASWGHMSGTCNMGPDSDDSTTSVVDTKFRVRGVSNLRVVDASVMPVITNSNLNAPIMMLAEKAAEDIINQWQSR